MGGTLTLSTFLCDRLALRFSLCRLGLGSYEQGRQLGSRGINFLVLKIYESTAAGVLPKDTGSTREADASGSRR